MIRRSVSLGRSAAVVEIELHRVGGHAQALDEEQDVLVHLRVAGSRRMGWRTRVQVRRSMCAGEDELRAHHSNGHGSVVFREAKRDRPGKWTALFVE